MAMVDVGPAAYRRTYSPSRLAWSEGRWPLDTALHSSNEPSELSQWLCHHDSTINIVRVLLLLLLFLLPAIRVITVGRREFRRTSDRDCRAWRTHEEFECSHTATVGHINVMSANTDASLVLRSTSKHCLSSTDSHSYVSDWDKHTYLVFSIWLLLINAWRLLNELRFLQHCRF